MASKGETLRNGSPRIVRIMLQCDDGAMIPYDVECMTYFSYNEHGDAPYDPVYVGKSVAVPCRMVIQWDTIMVVDACGELQSPERMIVQTNVDDLTPSM